MKHKLLKLNPVLLLVLILTPLYGQTTMNVKSIDGTQTEFTLSTIRKLTFPVTGSMTVTKTTGSTDNYTLTSVRYLQFSNVGTGMDTTPSIKTDLVLFPNPVDDVLNIRLSTSEYLNGAHTVSTSSVSTVEILSIDGRLLYKARFTDTGDNYQVNVSHYEQGIYLCRVNNGNSVETTKFFKK